MAGRQWKLKIGDSQCWGGVHWYGVLWPADPEAHWPLEVAPPRTRTRLEYPMTADDVTAFFKYDGSYLPKVGSLSERFWAYDDVLAAGLAEFNAVADAGDELILAETGERIAIK